MPVVDIQVVVDAEHTVPAGSAKAVAEALAAVLRAAPSHVWARLHHLPIERYAENGATAKVFPVFVKVLHADLPPQEALAAQASAMAQAVAACLDRGAEQVHIEYAPAGRGRVAFGGELVRRELPPRLARPDKSMQWPAGCAAADAERQAAHPPVIIAPRRDLGEGLRIRRASGEDALCLAVLAMQVFLDTYAIEGIRPQIAREVLSSYSEASFKHWLSDSNTVIEVAERDNHLIGFAQVTVNASHDLAPKGRQAELLRLYVQEPFTGQKVGTALLRRAEDVALERGATVMWLTPWVHNHRALAFYARRGYVDHGLTYFVFEGESHENRVLARWLPRERAA